MPALASAGAPAEWRRHAARAEIAERVASAAPEGVEPTPRERLLKELRRVAIDAERAGP
jgi:hypothetical protein